MQEKKKVRDRLTENPEDNSYINTMSLPDTRIWIRYRGRARTGVKANFKTLTPTTFLADSALESQTQYQRTRTKTGR